MEYSRDYKIICECCKSPIIKSYYCYECDSIICNQCRLFDDEEESIRDEDVNCKNCLYKHMNKKNNMIIINFKK